MVLIGETAFFLAVTLLQTPQQAVSSNDLTRAVRRLAAMAQLAAQEYRVGVVDGRVVSKAEVGEARLFLEESRKSAALLPDGIRSEVMHGLDSLILIVDGTGSPDSIDARVLRLTAGVSGRLGITLDELPTRTPELARGAEVYQANCAACHGMLGRGDGPAGRGLDPKPADLSDIALADQSPLDYYRRITMGVVGTSMPGFEVRLPPQDRWAAALYASLLRLPPPSGEVPSPLQPFATTGRLSDNELLQALREEDTESATLARVAAIRRFQADASSSPTGHVFATIRAQLESTYALARAGDSAAATRALDAYMTFEQVERGVRAKDPSLAADLEASFAALRGLPAGAPSGSDLETVRKQLALGLEKAERTLGADVSSGNLFLQSLVILVREGLEAILIIGALMTFLVKMGASQRKRDINLGVGAAIVGSLVTAFALESLFHLSRTKQEALEGVTLMLATAMLFYVSYWLLSKMEVVKWNHFVERKMHGALTSGSSLALASVAFVAVYREGFETVLFYKALFLSGEGRGGMPILGGILAGSLVLVAVYIAISRFGVRLPLKPFFGVTSALLYYLAFVFAGKGVAELQESGLVPTTVLPWAPRLPALGIYPTAESLLAQGVLLLLLVAAVAWTFVIEPRRNRGTSQATLGPRRARELTSTLERRGDLME